MKKAKLPIDQHIKHCQEAEDLDKLFHEMNKFYVSLCIVYWNIKTKRCEKCALMKNTLDSKT